MWKLNSDLTEIDTVKIDTLLPLFHIYNPAWENHFAATYLGNLGTPAQSNVPAERISKTGFILFQPVQDYMELQQNCSYYNTRKPFTEISYSTGGPKATAEQFLSATHTQNVNPRLNFALRYKLFSSGGQYPNQKAKNTAFSFSGNYIGDRYAAHGNVVVNKFDIQDNGGVLNDTIPNPQDFTWVPVNLEHAGNRYLHVGGLFTQSVGFGRFPWEKKDSITEMSSNYLSSFRYTVQYDRYYRVFYDSDLFGTSGSTDPGIDSAYFKNLDPGVETLSDSVFFRKFSQTLLLQLHESPGSWFRIKGNAGVFHEVFSYLNYEQRPKINFHSNHSSDPILPLTHNAASDHTVTSPNDFSRYLYNWGIQASLQNEAGRYFAWNASARYTLAGYNAGDYDLQVAFLGLFSGQWAAVQAGRSVHHADYYLKQYASGSFSWDFPGAGISLKPSGQSFAGVSTHGKLFDFTGEFRLFDRYMYINDSMPAQAESAFLTVSAVAGKKFNLGKFHSSFQTAIQYSGSELINLPAVTVKNTTWFEQSLVKDVLMSNLGFDVYYFTSYYADGYNPAIGLFYTQHNIKSGNYPYLDVFLNLKLKRTRIMLKYDHVNSGLLPRTYFTAMRYPMQARVFKFGVSWTFYD
jgi:hypothetical protein